MVPAGHRDRAIFEKLVELGLAVRGADIPANDILEGLTLKKLSGLAPGARVFTRKAQAICFLGSLRDIHQRLGNIMALRSAFQLRPLPGEFSGIDTGRVLSSWRYAAETARLIKDTFFRGNYAAYFEGEITNDAGFAPGWKVIVANNACPLCVEMGQRLCAENERPKAPFHMGCRCTVLVGLSQA